MSATLTQPKQGATPIQTVARRAGDVLWNHLDDEYPGLQAKIIASSDWREYLPADRANWFDGMTDTERWAVMVPAMNIDGSYEAEVATIAASADPETNAAFEVLTATPDFGERRLRLVPASQIGMLPVHWLWRNRIPLGELTLLAGREGLGKSTIAYTLAAWITTGSMEGDFHGVPRSVLVAATEDSWHQTIIPRLKAAGADLDRVFNVEMLEDTDSLELPYDIAELRYEVEKENAALVILDPLTGRLPKLDTHKDSDVRRALEPLVSFAKRSNAAVLGIMHVNKSHSTDASTTIMGSRAFPSVARSVLYAVKNPDNATCLLGFEKNNLGAKDDTTYEYRIVGTKVGDTAEGPIWTGKLELLGKSNRSVSEILEATADGMETLSLVDEAGAWLLDYLTIEGGAKESSIVKSAGEKAGHKEHNLKRAARKLKVRPVREGYPAVVTWYLPGVASPSENTFPGDVPTVPTVPTEQSERENLPCLPSQVSASWNRQNSQNTPGRDVFRQSRSPDSLVDVLAQLHRPPMPAFTITTTTSHRNEAP